MLFVLVIGLAALLNYFVCTCFFDLEVTNNDLKFTNRYQTCSICCHLKWKKFVIVNLELYKMSQTKCQVNRQLK